MQIDPQFIDVNFPSQPEYTFGDRGLGAFGATGLADYEQTLGVIPESEWRGLAEAMDANQTGLEWLIKHVFNQGQEPSCVSNATAQGMMVCAARQYGMERVPILSPISLYKRVGSPSSGSMLSDNVDEVMETGILPVNNEANKAVFTHTFPATGYHTKYPSGWETTAGLLKLEECYVVRSVGAMFSAQFRGHPVLVGRQGHSILYIRPKWESNRWIDIYLNSWGDWGFGAGVFQAGFGADSMSLIKQSAAWAVAFRTVEMKLLA